MSEDDLHSLLFDRYQRFRCVAERIEDMALGENLKILDVGSHDAAFGDFLPGHRVRPYDQKITRDEFLPFKDDFFDVAVAIDVLEHVATQDRRTFLGELERVSASAMIVSFPTPQAAPVEAYLYKYTKNPWLKEHMEQGLPDPEEIEALLTGLGLTYERHPNAALASWLTMWLLGYILKDEPRQELNEFFNRNFYEAENREPAYRYVYVCRKNSPTGP